MVSVRLGTAQRSVTADGSGHWQATFDTATIGVVGAGLQRLQTRYTNAQGQEVNEFQHVLIAPGTLAPRASRALAAAEPGLHIGMYSSDSLMFSQPELVQALGRDLGPQYGLSSTFASSYWQAAADQGFRVPYMLGWSGTYENIKADVLSVLQDPVKNQAVWAWYGPEEVRNWVADELSGVTTMQRAIRDAESEAGAAPRPFYQYLPNHTDTGRANAFVGINDLMSKGAYFQVGTSNAANYEAIRSAADVMVTASRNSLDSRTDAGAVGADFTPFLALGAYTDPAAGVSADKLATVLRTGFYLALSRGVQGIDVWSYVTRSGFSAQWRDAYVDSYVAAGTELNMIEPELGAAMAQGLRLESVSGVSFPVSVNTASGKLSSARFFYKGQIYLMLVNTDEAQSVSVQLSDLGDFVQYREILTPSTAALQTATGAQSLALSLAPESVRFWRFTDPNTTPQQSGTPPALAWDASAFMLQQGRAGTGFAGSDNSRIVKPEAFGITGVEGLDPGQVQVQIWCRDAPAFNDTTTNFFYRKDAPSESVTRFSLKELQDGLIEFKYNGQGQPPTFSVRVTDNQGHASDWQSVQASFATPNAASNTGILLFGDGSGSGGHASLLTCSGGDGSGGADELVGTDKADIIFGDGSGGGEGSSPYSAGRASGLAGRGGSGKDTLRGGAGDDLMFGDGFAATPSVGDSIGVRDGTVGGYGGGGNGSQINVSAQAPNVLGGGLAGEALAGATGGQSTFGWAGVPSTAGTANGYLRSAPGLGVTGNPKYGANVFVAGVNGDEETVQSLLTSSVYDSVLRDLQKGTGADARPHSQVMGQGQDWIDGGAGQDWIMAGGGSDTIIGGQGNDVMWGTGGARGLPMDISASTYTSGPTARVDLTWTPMETGQSLSCNGLTFTASRYLTADEAASAWANLGASAGTPASTLLGSYSGAWGNTWTTGPSTGAQLSVNATDATARWDLRGTMSTNGGPVRDNNVFVWNDGDAQGGAVDVIKDFVVWDAVLPGNGPKGDRLDISALLQGYTPGTSDLSQWVTLATSAVVNGTASLTIDLDGTPGGTTQVINLQGTNLNGYSLDKLVTDGVLLA